jgi:predicted transcriptional regulator
MVRGSEMAITVQLTPEQEATLKELAEQLRIPPEDLAGVAVRDLLAQRDEDFLRIAKQVVEENRELYQRLR